MPPTPVSRTADRFWARVLLLVASIPAFYLLIFALPAFHHLLFSVCATVAAVLGSREVAKLFVRRGMTGHWPMAAVFSALFPVTAYLENWSLVSAHAFGGVAAAVVAAAIAVAVLRSPHRSDAHPNPVADANPLAHAGATLIASLYPGLFIGYIVRLAGIGDPQWMLLTFFVAVFGNDTAAYVAGKLAGGRTVLKLPASPTKTAVGYATGVAASVVALIVAQRVFPGAPQFGTLEAALGGVALGVFVAVGDLVESALKRAAQVKDSGGLIPGRGGLLDSIDSLLLCAPLFFFWMQRVDWAPV